MEKKKKVNEKSAVPLFVCRNLVKIYQGKGTKTVALRKLSCTIYKGEITIIMGPSGSGKTTFLNILGGLDKADAGELFFEERNITALGSAELEDYRKNFGYVFQFFNLIQELNVRDNLLTAIYASNPNISKKDAEGKYRALLKKVGLSHKEKSYPNELSGGEQQRIALAVALAGEPRVLLCDEPTGELDSSSKFRILQLLKDIHKEYPDLSIIIVTHDNDFRLIADRLYIIKDGMVIHESFPEKKDIPQEQEIKGEASEVSFSEPLPSLSLDFSGIMKKEEILHELMELEHTIKEKIKKLEENGE